MESEVKETSQTFTCSNCSSEKELKELAKTVEVYNSEPIKTCRECYDLFHNPPKKKKTERSFICAFCRFEVTSICYQIKVSVSEPNELGLKNGETYNFCSVCKSKVKEYGTNEERDWEKEPPEIWE